MLKKCKLFLYSIDAIGTRPQLFIFNNKRYKSIFSSLTSLFIIFISIIFVIYSLMNI